MKVYAKEIDDHTFVVHYDATFYDGKHNKVDTFIESDVVEIMIYNVMANGEQVPKKFFDIFPKGIEVVNDLIIKNLVEKATGIKIKTEAFDFSDLLKNFDKKTMFNA